MKHWTIRIGKKWLSINARHLVGIGILIGGVIFAFVFTTFVTIGSNIRTNKFVNAKNRASELKLALENTRDRMNSLNKKLDSVVTLDVKERLVWNLPCIDEDLRKLGVGGREFNNRECTVSEISELISGLKRKLDFEFESFGEIHQRINQKKNAFLHTPSIWPTYGTFTSGFGWRNRPFGREFHKGIDIANRIGTPIAAAASGVVTYVKYAKGLGLLVELDHGFGYKTRYGHLSRASVKPGEKVERGKIIGMMGNTGRSTGPHLHYEVKVLGKTVNPRQYIIPGTTTY